MRTFHILVVLLPLFVTTVYAQVSDPVSMALGGCLLMPASAGSAHAAAVVHAGAESAFTFSADRPYRLAPWQGYAAGLRLRFPSKWVSGLQAESGSGRLLQGQQVSLFLARKWSEHFSSGLRFSASQTRVFAGEAAATAFSAQYSMHIPLLHWLTAGLMGTLRTNSLSYENPLIAKSSIPAARVGLSVKLENDFIFYIEEEMFSRTARFAAGAVYTYQEVMEFRAGLHNRPLEASAGLGWKYREWMVTMAIALNSQLGNGYSLGISRKLVSKDE